MSAYNLEPEVREHLDRFWRVIEEAPGIDRKELLESFIVAILGAERHTLLMAFANAEDMHDCVDIVRKRMTREIPATGLIRTVPDVGV